MMSLDRQRMESLLGRTCGKIISKGLEGLVRWVSSHEETVRSARGSVTYAADGHAENIVITLIGEDKRAASVSLGRSDDSGIDRAIAAAAAMLPYVPPNPYPPDLIGPGEAGEGTTEGYDEETARGGLEIKADFFSRAHRMAALAGYRASGRFFTGHGEIAVATTKGMFRYHPFTVASCGIVIAGASGSVSSDPDRRYVSAHAAGSGVAVRKIDGASLIDVALERARLEARLPFVNPFVGGASELRFDAVLSPLAMNEWLFMLSAHGLGGLSVVEGTGCLAGKIGTRVSGERLTLTDDWTRAGMPPLPFDSDGRDRQIVPLIERGIARGVVWDGATAKKAEGASTGHANDMLFGDESEASVMPLHLVMEGGDTAPGAMVKDAVRPTLLVSHFNYANMPDPQGAVFTATTRHGTFLIEGGEYVAVLPPLRMQEKSLEAFSRIEALSRSELVIPFENYGGVVPVGTLVPWTKIAGLAFIGAVV